MLDHVVITYIDIIYRLFIYFGMSHISGFYLRVILENQD